MPTFTLKSFCLFIALILFGVAAVWSPGRFNLVAGGLFFVTAAAAFG